MARKRPIVNRTSVIKALVKAGLDGFAMMREAERLDLALYVDPFPFNIIVNNLMNDSQVRVYPNGGKRPWSFSGNDETILEFIGGFFDI